MFEDFCKTDEFHERWKYEARNYIVDLEWRRRKLALRIKGEEKRVTEEEKAEAAQRRQECARCHGGTANQTVCDVTSLIASFSLFLHKMHELRMSPPPRTRR